MWVFTKDGFYSAVENREDYGQVVVRARSRVDIVRLAKRLTTKAYKSKRSDYPYRLFCSKMEWAEYLARCAVEIDYDNFKSAMARHFGAERMEQLHDVWAVMAGFGFPVFPFEEENYETEETLYDQLAALRGLRREDSEESKPRLRNHQQR